MHPTRNLTEYEVLQASALLKEGYSQSYIATVLCKSRTTISRMVRRLNEEGNYSRKPGQGRKRCTDQRDEQFLRQYALTNKAATNSMMQKELEAIHNVTISSTTVRRRLNEAGLDKRLTNTYLLSTENKNARLQFAQNHENWSVDDWKRVFFTDETKVHLKHPECHGSILFWGGISFEGRTELVPIHARSLNADYYLENIVVDHVIPFSHFVGPNFLFMQDTTPPHLAKEVLDYLNHVGIPLLQWPPKSPDMNPITGVWNNLKKRVKHHIPAPSNLKELETAVIIEWEKLPQDDIQNLIRSMPERIKAVIQNKGDNTHY